MKRKIVGILITLLLLYSVYSFADLKPFPSLKTIEVPRLFAVASRLEPMNIRIHYDPAVTTLINKRHKSKGGFEEIEILSTKLDRKSDKLFTVYYSPGQSADPSFRVCITDAGTVTGEFPGLELFIPGNGTVYIMGHTNNYFNKHKKFAFESGKLVEVKQPFYFVGLESKAKRDIPIFYDKMEKIAVAIIPSGSKLTVILNDGENYYLIKTSFGLTGWANYRVEYASNFIEGLFYNGD